MRIEGRLVPPDAAGDAQSMRRQRAIAIIAPRLATGVPRSMPRRRPL
jgi:hypothetical protein